MVLAPISRQIKTLTPPLSHAAARRLLSSVLRDRYNFISPPSLHPPNPNNTPTTPPKKKKPPYRPPSSLDRTGLKPLHSDAPFDFRFSYTESNPAVKPIGLREPKYSPFGPGRVDRPWTGICAPAVDHTVRSVDGDGEVAVDTETARRRREEVLGEPLTPAERGFLIDKCQKHRTKRQVNLGRDGLTHNMLADIHNNWKHVEAVRIKCLGVPTVDMKNVCTQLEEKTGGLIIHRHGGQIILYRGRHYNTRRRPVIPLMLWKPREPIYPRLIKTTIEGLTIEETKEMRKQSLSVPVLTKLGNSSSRSNFLLNLLSVIWYISYAAKNGYYASLVPMVRDAFLTDELIRIDCKGLEKSDYRKIGCKLRDLVPCVLVSFDKEQIVVWRGNNYGSCSHRDTDEKSYSPLPEPDAGAEPNHESNAEAEESDADA